MAATFFRLCLFLILTSAVICGSSAAQCGMDQPDVLKVDPVTKAAKEALIKSLLQMKTLTASFQQQTSEGERKTGVILLMRPGKLKMQIEAPQEELLIVKGNWLVHHIPLMGETTHIPLDETPARVLLEDDAALQKRLEGAQVIVDKEQIHLNLQYQAEGLESTLVMSFDKLTFILEKWYVIDSSGHETVVHLSQIQLNTPIDKKEFIFKKEH